MTDSEYEAFNAPICAAGCFVTNLEDMGGWRRATVCSKRLDGGRLTGNSFWVTRIADNWYLGAWGGYLYRLSDKQSIVETCVALLSFEPEKTHGDFDEQLKAEFELVAVPHEKFDTVTGP